VSALAYAGVQDGQNLVGDLGVLNTGKGKGLREFVDGIGAQKIEIQVLPD